jgi:hypothetical protein
MEHLELVKAALTAIDRVNNDMSVEPSTTKESLEEIREEIDTMMDALEDME